MKIVFIPLLVLIFFTANSQVNPSPVSERVSSSVQVHALQGSEKKVDYSGSDFIKINESGDMSFSIPLTQANGRKLSFPITANYKAGIKVEQKSSEIGLGWSINFGSIIRDYGAFEPDYAETSIEAKMVNTINGVQGLLSNIATSANPFSNNKSLLYQGLVNSTGTDKDRMTPDIYRLNSPNLGSNSFWNNSDPNLNHDFIFENVSPWKIEYSTKTFEVDQEYSRINELTYQNIFPFGVLDNSGNIAAAICIPPYVEDRYFERTTTGGVLSSGTVYSSKVKYKDFDSFTIIDENGNKYIFGRPLREQKYLITEDPFWSTMSDGGNFPSNASYGEWWKIDYIAEWLLTEIISSDYFDANNNGFVDREDEGDWIKFVYTDPEQSESIPGSNVNSIIVPKHREWLNFSQTDKYSSLMRERAYLKKIITPIQEINLYTSSKLDVDHDYFKIPLNNPDPNRPYIYKDLTPNGGGSNSSFHIEYPNELLKYDSITIHEHHNESNYSRKRNISTIIFNYAHQGSEEELAVSNYLIRDNTNEETVPYDPSIVGPELDSNGNQAGFNIENYYKNEGRGKTTLLGIDFYPSSEIRFDKRSFSFEHAVNPNFDFYKRFDIIRKNSFPFLRQSKLQNERRSVVQKNVKTSLLPYKSKEIGINLNGGSWLDYNFEVVSCFIDNLNSMEGKTTLGYYRNENIPLEGRDAWSISKIKIPTGGEVLISYENDNFDYNTDLTISSDRKEWNDIGSLIDNQLPFIDFYNNIAELRSLIQGNINAISHSNLKKLYRSYHMPLTENSGGLRLSKIEYQDGINPNIIKKYEYGPGHYTSVPLEYWNNYISGFSSFMQSERARAEGPSAYYNLSFPFDDFSTTMAALSINIRADNSLKGSHFYEYIFEILGNEPLAINSPRIKYYYGDVITRQKKYDFQKNVYLKGYDRFNFPITEAIVGENNLCSQVGLLKTEYYESNNTNPYSFEDSFFECNVNEYKLNSFSEFNLPNFEYPLFYPSSDGIIYHSTDFYNYELTSPFEGSHSFEFENDCTNEIDPNISQLSSFYHDVLIPEIPNTDNIVDNGYSVEDLNIIQNQSILLTKSIVNSNYLGIEKEKHFHFDQQTGLIKKEILSNINKVVDGNNVSKSKVTEYNYGYEDIDVGAEFISRNILSPVITTNSKVELNSNSLSSTELIKSKIVNWGSHNSNGFFPLSSFDFNSSIQSSGITSGSITSFTPFDFSLNSNSPKWQNYFSITDYNRYGQPKVQKHGELFTVNTFGYNSSIPKANFTIPDNFYDATYTGFEDLYFDDGTLDLWESYEDEFWYDLNIPRNQQPTESSLIIYVYKNPDPVCIVSNYPPACNISPTSCDMNGSSGYLYSYGDYKIRIDNSSGNWNIGDQVRIYKNLDPEVNIDLNSLSINQYDLPDFFTTITDIVYRPTVSEITSAYGFPQSLINYSNWDNYDYYLCLSDPIPDEYNVHFGVHIEKIEENDIQSFVTKKEAHTGKYSYWLGNHVDPNQEKQKTPVRPIYSAGLGPRYKEFKASVWLKKRNPNIPAGEIFFNYVIWNNDRTGILDGGTRVVNNIDTEWRQHEILIERTTQFSGILEVYIENGWTSPQSDNTLYVDDLLIYPKDAKYEYYSFDRYLNTTHITDNNDNSSFSEYDHWGRRKRQFNFNGNNIEDYNYFISNNLNLKHNYNEVTTYLNTSSNSKVRDYLDGFGNKIQSQISEPSKNRILFESLEYDDLGRVNKNYKTLGIYGTSFSNKKIENFNDELNLVYGSNSSPYQEIEYYDRPQEKVFRINYSYNSTNTPPSFSESNDFPNLSSDVIFSNISYPNNELLIDSNQDENLNSTQNYKDKEGNLILLKRELGKDYSFTSDGVLQLNLSSSEEFSSTYFEYDLANNQTKVHDPEGVITIKKYNSLGQIINHYHPDKGLTEYKYDHFGRLRYIQDANDKELINSNSVSDAFTYFKYDKWDRLIEIGKYLPLSSNQEWILSSNVNNSIFPEESNPHIQRHKQWIYDGPKEFNCVNRIYQELVQSDFSNVGGEYLANHIDTYSYKYDNNGNIIEIEYNLDGLAGNHILNYDYNFQNQIIDISYRNPIDENYNYIEQIQYDDFGRIINTSSGIDDNSMTNDSKYSYDILGNLKTMTLAEHSADKETVSFQYDIRNRLIEQVSQNFRFQLKYDLKGNITKQIWSNSHFDVSLSPFTSNSYNYFYDKMDRLVGANYESIISENYPYNNYENLISQNQPDFNCTYLPVEVSLQLERALRADMDLINEKEYPNSFNFISILRKLNYHNVSTKTIEYEKSKLKHLNEELEEYSSIMDSEEYEIINLIEADLKRKNEFGLSNFQKEIETILNKRKRDKWKRNQIIKTLAVSQADAKMLSQVLDKIELFQGILTCSINEQATALNPLSEELLNPVEVSTNKYDTQYWYSNSGNFNTLKRFDWQGNIEQLDYYYQIFGNQNTNRISNISHTNLTTPNFTQNITYDNNGNIISDNGIASNIISLNYFNLISQISNDQNEQFNYRYDIENNRVFKNINNNQYEFNIGNVIMNNNGIPLRFETHNGYYDFTNKYYNMDDWLSSNRLTILDKQTIINSKDYFPYGSLLSQRHYSSNFESNRYQFIGHERDVESNYNYHLSRFYNDETCLYYSIDPMQYLYNDFSPYSYSFLNPINYLDFNGKSPDQWNLKYETGELVKMGDAGGNEVQYIDYVKQHENGGFYKIGETQIIQGSKNEIFQGESAQGHFVSKYDLWRDLPTDYNKNSGYNYTVSDLYLRNWILNSPKSYSGFAVAVRNNEASGYADPITSGNYWKKYGESLGKMKLIDAYLGMANGLLSGQRATSTKIWGQRLGSTPIKNYSLATPKKINRSFSEFLQTRKGKDLGLYNGRGNWMKHQAILYNQSK